MSKRKYEKPLKLDIEFEQSLERFAKTDPHEVNDLVNEDRSRLVPLVEDDNGHRFLIYTTERGIEARLLRKIAREVRTSYREVLRLCTFCSDYDGSSQAARDFFMDMENKLLWASANKTAPQLVLERCAAEKKDLGLTYYAGKRGPTQRDVVIGNNYPATGEAE